jgi:protein involved in ribonucleotide reduction
MEEKLFKVIDPKDNSDVMGGAIGIGNAAFTIMSSFAGSNIAKDLQVGHITNVNFSCSGTRACYIVERVR